MLSYVNLLKYLFNLSIVKGIFPDHLGIAKVTPIYKADSSNNIIYWLISVLPCFSKMLERIMYNRLQKYLKDQNILYDKQFGFQTGHSTCHCTTGWSNLWGFWEKRIYFRFVYWFAKGFQYCWSFHTAKEARNIWHNW